MCNHLIDIEINHLISNFKESKNIKPLIKDLSYLKTYTIDDSQTVEIDDAVSLEKTSGQYKLWIHISSPTSNLRHESEIDKKARKLNSTVYLSDITLYMLPEVLINEVFSLSNKEKRESISLGIIFNEDGSVYDSEIVQSLIKVNYRLNYKEADELIDYAPKEEEDLSIISSILQKRKSWRKNLGAIEILESYAKIVVEDNIPAVKIIDPTLSRQLISEAMILYGNLISDYTKENKIPIPYRVQENKIKVCYETLNPLENNVLNNFKLKKSMGKTYYSICPMSHKGLGLSSYTHATSPIRRYSDLLVHYQLNRHLNNKVLISKEHVEEIIQDINNIGRQNVMRYREDQKKWLYKWFEHNSFKEYQVILLNWINKYRNTCILYFLEYNISCICNLKSKLNINIGDEIKVKDITNNYNDIIYFQLIS